MGYAKQYYAIRLRIAHRVTNYNNTPYKSTEFTENELKNSLNNIYLAMYSVTFIYAAKTHNDIYNIY